MRKLLGWDRYDSPAAVEAMNDLYRHELRLWLNLYLPSVKLVKRVRVGSKLRRVYGAPQTPFERVLASPQANPTQLAALQSLLKSLDPFRLAKVIDQKLERIYELANRRLSLKAPQELPPPKRKSPSGEKAVEKMLRGKVQRQTFPLRLGIPHPTRDSHFPTATTTTVPLGYISNGATTYPTVTFLNGLTRPLLSREGLTTARQTDRGGALPLHCRGNFPVGLQNIPECRQPLL